MVLAVRGQYVCRYRNVPIATGFHACHRRYDKIPGKLGIFYVAGVSVNTCPNNQVVVTIYDEVKNWTMYWSCDPDFDAYYIDS